MTATMTPDTAQNAPEPGKTKKAAGLPAKLTLSGDPSVQLLPPSVRNRAVVRSRIRTAVLFVILGALVAAGLVAAGTVRAGQAQQALNDANNRTVELLAAQAEYADIVRLNSLVTEAETLQLFATETEVDWAALLRELTARMPEGTVIESVTASGFAPWESPDYGGSAGVDGAIAVLQLSLSSNTIQDATQFSRNLADLEGYGISVISNVAVGTEGRVTTQLSLAIGAEATSGRFREEDEEETVTSTDGATDAESPAADETEGEG